MRLRHYRGRKIHSPFVYRIVRECLMTCRRAGAEEQIAALFEYLRRNDMHPGDVTCVVCHRGNRRTRREMVDGHRGTSFETRRFLCLFANERLPKQHFKL